MEPTRVDMYHKRHNIYNLYTGIGRIYFKNKIFK